MPFRVSSQLCSQAAPRITLALTARPIALQVARLHARVLPNQADVRGALQPVAKDVVEVALEHARVARELVQQLVLVVVATTARALVAVVATRDVLEAVAEVAVRDVQVLVLEVAVPIVREHVQLAVMTLVKTLLQEVAVLVRSIADSLVRPPVPTLAEPDVTPPAAEAV